MLGDMMRQAQVLQEKMAQTQAEVGKKTVEANSGGGMVTVVANGRQEIISIKIDPQVVNPEDIEMLQDLILASMNEALKKSKEMMAEEMKGLTGGLNIPGMF
ncbi:MAG: YbaB/EbfC family nucleoid-associated protein [Nitrospirae bacterium]|nr:YbaB/EbfC family nucleoid-associated protein [Nitrospirota bacterium]MBI3351274.1 YbaB/EbfC family nucleoid-associated protein [Nitrospirota bacterium]